MLRKLSDLIPLTGAVLAFAAAPAFAADYCIHLSGVVSSVYVGKNFTLPNAGECAGGDSAARVVVLTMYKPELPARPPTALTFPLASRRSIYLATGNSTGFVSKPYTLLTVFDHPHILIGKSEMVTNFMHQNMSNNRIQRHLTSRPKIEDRIPIEKNPIW
jgi:hypothetical protein